jgi:hypothetical protein
MADAGGPVVVPVVAANKRAQPPGKEEKNGKRKHKSEQARLVHEINLCHKTQDVDKGMTLMQELLGLGHSPSPETFTSLLNLVCIHGPERWSDVRMILDCMAEHRVALGEAGITSLIRLLMATGDAPAALEMLEKLEKHSEQPLKRRAVMPVLEGVCAGGDGAAAMQVVDILKTLVNSGNVLGLSLSRISATG